MINSLIKTRNVYDLHSSNPVYEFELNGKYTIKIPLRELIDNKADKQYIINKIKSQQSKAID